MIRRRALFGVLLAAMQLGALHAQGPTQSPDTPPSEESGGFRLHSVSGFMTYLSQPVASAIATRSAAFMDQTGFGGAATVGYSRFEERTGISLSYRSSYMVGLRDYGTNIQGHSLSFNVRRSLTPKWTHTFGVAGTVNSIADALFVPSATANIAGTRATFDQLSGAMVSGTYTNGPLATALTGAQPLDSPAAWALYGSRILTSTARSDLSYAYTSRLQFHLTVDGSRSQPLKDDRLTAPSHPAYLLAHTTSGKGNFGVSYSLSPRTQIGAGWSTGRSVSNLLDAYSHIANVSLSRIMSRLWFVELHAGAGTIRPIRQSIVVSRSLRSQGGGGIGYRTYAHTLLLSTARSVGDAYGLGASTSLSTSGAWTWNRPGNSWSMAADIGQQRLSGSSFSGITSWRGSAGLTHRVGRNVAFATQYAYLGGTQFYGLTGAAGSRHQLRMSVIWTPDGMSR